MDTLTHIDLAYLVQLEKLLNYESANVYDPTDYSGKTDCFVNNCKISNSTQLK